MEILKKSIILCTAEIVRSTANTISKVFKFYQKTLCRPKQNMLTSIFQKTFNSLSYVQIIKVYFQIIPTKFEIFSFPIIFVLLEYTVYSEADFKFSLSQKIITFFALLRSCLTYLWIRL